MTYTGIDFEEMTQTTLRKPPIASEGLSGTNLVRAGEHNQRVILQAIRSNASITRTELTAITGLTPPAVAKITNRLLEERLIQTSGKVLGSRGQPASKFVISPQGAYALGLNIDRDHTTLVAMDFGGQVVDSCCMEGHFALPHDVLSFVQAQIDRLKREKRFNMNRLAGIGIGIPDKLGDIPLPNKPAGYEIWSQIDVCEFFSEALALPAYIENDATAAAIGELHFGGGGSHQNFMFTLISAGLGCGIIIGGQPYRGADGRSGEIAFIARDLFQSSHPGIVQDNLSLYSLYAFLAERGISASTPSDIKPDHPEHADAIEIWSKLAADELLGTVAVLNCALNPDSHIIGGRLPAAVIERICNRLNEQLALRLPQAPSVAQVRPAKAVEDAAPMGAAMLVFQNRYLPTPEVLMKTEYA
ncbi:ROK family transcriptional regulator [Asticcacaulis machinosus]|uniref:ROK family transcriptional regulator n=1 Tax=Asticcacaulis machinosus TaxID=2984211 RepID=A0ABT5HMY1_9CAUL|nr:ROK family transcriptional regulator [Asticcacaulis machinosus]MDC7677485.1 ROK family transcriptional regulator [Asticcacaulis machinosus]